MFDLLFYWLSGFCRFSAQAANPVRLFNRLHEEQIYFWKPKLDQTRLSFYCRRSNMQESLNICQKLGVSEITVKQIGLPHFFDTPIRKCMACLILVLTLLPVFLVPNFVMDIRVSGNHSVSDESILQILEQEGIHRYSYIPGLPLKQARQQLLLSQPKLCWATVNLTGNELEVIVQEKTGCDVIMDTDPCNIVAATDGVLCRTEVLSGKQVVFGKVPVRKGQLLVSGFLETETGKLSYLHASAKMIAEVELQKSFTVDLQGEDYVPLSQTQKQYDFLCFGHVFSLHKKPNIKQPYTISQQQTLFSIGKWKLPLGICCNTYTYYQKQSARLSQADADEILAQQFVDYETYELADAAIVEKNFAKQQEGSRVTMTGIYRVQMDLAKEVPILIGEP